MNLKEKIKKIGFELGFDWVSISPATPLEEDRKHYQEWCAKGYAAGLSYMVREFPRRWVPQDLLPEAKSVITFVVSYNSVFPATLSTPSSYSPIQKGRIGYGRVARYAWGKDYHIVIRKRLEEWVKLFSEAVGKKIKTKILVDSAPFLERAYANRGDLGFIGKNTLWISKKYGSFVFLAEVLLDLEVEVDSSSRDKTELSLSQNGNKKERDPCGSCKECITACPTGAFVSARELDARKCISYWTIEHRGEIPEEIRPQIGDWIFGCDICQEVCPYNKIPCYLPSSDNSLWRSPPHYRGEWGKREIWKEFLPEAGAGPFLSLREVLSIQTEAEFKKKFAETPILRAKRSGLVRNACVVSANQNFTEAIPLLLKLAETDSDPIIRSHATWAVKNLVVGASAPKIVNENCFSVGLKKKIFSQ